MIPFYFLEEQDSKMNSDFPFNIFTQKITASILPHGHNFLELHYIIEGEGKEVINGEEYSLKPGTFAIILPHQVHEMEIPPGQAVLLYNFGIPLKFFFETGNTDLSLKWLLFDLDLGLKPFYHLHENAAKKIHSLLDEIYTEFTGSKDWNRLMFRIKLIELMIEFDRYRKSVPLKSSGILNTDSQSDIWTLIHHVYKNYQRSISLKDLSEQFHFTVPYISTAFKKCLGVNFHNFLNHIRTEHACSLLTSGKMAVTDIAYEVGFESYSTFVRVFHKYKGMSPTDYQRLRSPEH